MRLSILSVMMGTTVSTVSCGFILPTAPCPDENSDAIINVAGTYRYNAGGGDFFNLSGTIIFEQDGDLVRVINTTYDLGGNRALDGEASLRGNRLDIQLFPLNGDTDYRADVTLVFTEDGDEFCVEFSDTNGDAGDLGSFVGRRMQ